MENYKTSRESETRKKESRKKDWTPPSSLDAPAAPQGYAHRWIRTSANGFDDPGCLLYTSPSPRDAHESRMPSSA